MSGSCALDTNIVIALFDGDGAVKRGLTQAEEVFIPSIVVGELYYGARKSGRAEKNVTRVNEFITDNSILVVDAETADQYGIIKNKLRLKGRPIPENDMWIAALVLQHNFTLVTRDAHFKHVDGLDVVSW